MTTRIAIGPLFVRTEAQPNPAPEIASLGISVELANADFSYLAPLYRKINSWNPQLCTLTEILVHESNLPCEFVYRPIFAVQTQAGLFIPFEALLVGIYQTFQLARSIFDVFIELRDIVEFSEGKITTRQPLIPAAAQIGFEIIRVESYGRRLLVDVDWFPPQDRAKPERHLNIDAAAVDFRPLPDGTLGRGKWNQPKEGFARVLLYAELRKVVPGDPIDLFTDAGRQELLSQFNWTPLARLTNKQARAARLQFIALHPELINDTRKLAEAMQQAGLYSPDTTTWQIAKFIPSLLRKEP